MYCEDQFFCIPILTQLLRDEIQTKDRQKGPEANSVLALVTRVFGSARECHGLHYALKNSDGYAIEGVKTLNLSYLSIS